MTEQLRHRFSPHATRTLLPIRDSSRLPRDGLVFASKSPLKWELLRGSSRSRQVPQVSRSLHARLRSGTVSASHACSRTVIPGRPLGRPLPYELMKHGASIAQYARGVCELRHSFSDWSQRFIKRALALVLIGQKTPFPQLAGGS